LSVLEETNDSATGREQRIVIEYHYISLSDRLGDPVFGMPDNPQPDTLDKIKCPKCGHLNRPGTLLCDNCGTLLLGTDKDPVGTRKLQEGDLPDESPIHQTLPPNKAPVAPITSDLRSLTTPPPVDRKPTPAPLQTNTVFEENMVLRLDIEGAPNAVLVYPKRETTIGRRDPSTGTMPDVDLTAYAGYRLGVSRKHAVIRLQSKRLEIYDLGSSNGTTLNGVRLAAHQPHLLRDGDEIALGKMVIRVIFQSNRRPPA
jgi:hypothetical protein